MHKDININIDIEKDNNNNDINNNKNNWCITFTWLFSINLTIFLLIVLLPLSFVYIEYNEMAFDRNKFGTVDTSYVLTQGRHYLPLTHELVKFPTTFNKIAFLKSNNNALSIFTQDGYQISIEVQFYYRLLTNNLKLIYDTYSMNYELGVINLAKLIIRELSGSANSGVYLPLHSYINNRTYIQNKYASEVHRRMELELAIDVPIEYFKIIELDIPNDMVARYERSVIQIQDNEVKENTQVLLATEAETDKLISIIDANTTNLLRSTDIISKSIDSNANISSDNIINNANIFGFKYLCDMLNISNSSTIIKLSTSLNLLENPASKLFFNMNNNIIVT
jgi:hypothetical protein